jgi:3-hydroxyisobutyrate dehydrogenase-like beta-hydroxyacid dehydrogenase
MLNLKGRPMFEERFEPALFKLEHMLKDLRHAIEEASALGIELRLPALAEGLYDRAVEDGHGEEDFAAVYRALD